MAETVRGWELERGVSWVLESAWFGLWGSRCDRRVRKGGPVSLRLVWL